MPGPARPNLNCLCVDGSEAPLTFFSSNVGGCMRAKHALVVLCVWRHRVSSHFGCCGGRHCVFSSSENLSSQALPFHAQKFLKTYKSRRVSLRPPPPFSSSHSIHPHQFFLLRQSKLCALRLSSSLHPSRQGVFSRVNYLLHVLLNEPNNPGQTTQPTTNKPPKNHHRHVPHYSSPSTGCCPRRANSPHQVRWSSHRSW